MNRILIISIITILLVSCKKEDTKLPIQISADVKNVSIYGATDGYIKPTITGGSNSYSYLWSNGATTKDLLNIPEGNYTLTVTDSKGDTASHSETVLSPSELNASFEKKDVSAVGENNGNITLTIEGGTPPYNFLWNDNSTQSSRDELSAGTYSVTVTDNDGAVKQLDIQILSPLTLTLSGIDVTSINGTNGSIDLLIQGGLEPYTIEWSEGSSIEDLSNIKAGYYDVTVTDANSVVKKKNITIYEPFENSTPEGKLLSNITRLTQSGLRIESQSKVIYIDPINIYPGHTADADIILITHNHGDHFSSSVISQLLKGNTNIIVPADIYNSVLGIAGSNTVIKIAPDSSKIINGIEIEAVPAYNSYHMVPNSVGYILTLDGVRLYHSGDTKKIPEMNAFNADIACLPMGQTYTFSSISEAVEAAKALNAKVVLPIHYANAEGTYKDPWIFKEMMESEIDVCIKPTF